MLTPSDEDDTFITIEQAKWSVVKRESVWKMQGIADGKVSLGAGAEEG